MSTPLDNKKISAPKTPGFTRALFGFLSGSKVQKNEDENKDVTKLENEPSINEIRKPRVLFVNNGPDLISGTPQINRNEIRHQMLTLPSGGKKLKSNTNENSTSPWVPTVQYPVDQQSTRQISQSSGMSRIQQTKSEEVSRKTFPNSVQPCKKSHKYRPKLTNRTILQPNRFQVSRGESSSTLLSKQIAEGMREVMNQFEPNQLMLAKTISANSSSNGYTQFVSSGRLFSKQRRLRPLPSNTAIIITGTKHTLDPEEHTKAAKRQKVTFSQTSSTGESSISAAPSSTIPNPSSRFFDELSPSIGFDLNKPFELGHVIEFDGTEPDTESDMILPSIWPSLGAPCRLPSLPQTTQVGNVSKKSFETKNKGKEQEEPKSGVSVGTNNLDGPEALSKRRKQSPTSFSQTGSSASSSQTGSATKTNGWGNLFSSQKKLWQCSVCLVKNAQELNKCASCETPRPQEHGKDDKSDTPAVAVNSGATGAIKTGNQGFVFNGNDTNESSKGTIGSGGFVFGIKTPSNNSSAGSLQPTSGFSFGVSSFNKNAQRDEEIPKIPTAAKSNFSDSGSTTSAQLTSGANQSNGNWKAGPSDAPQVESSFQADASSNSSVSALPVDFSVKSDKGFVFGSSSKTTLSRTSYQTSSLSSKSEEEPKSGSTGVSTKPSFSLDASNTLGSSGSEKFSFGGTSKEMGKEGDGDKTSTQDIVNNESIQNVKLFQPTSNWNTTASSSDSSTLENEKQDNQKFDTPLFQFGSSTNTMVKTSDNASNPYPASLLFNTPQLNTGAQFSFGASVQKPDNSGLEAKSEISGFHTNAGTSFGTSFSGGSETSKLGVFTSNPINAPGPLEASSVTSTAYANLAPSIPFTFGASNSDPSPALAFQFGVPTNAEKNHQVGAAPFGAFNNNPNAGFSSVTPVPFTQPQTPAPPSLGVNSFGQPVASSPAFPSFQFGQAISGPFVNPPPTTAAAPFPPSQQINPAAGKFPAGDFGSSNPSSATDFGSFPSSGGMGTHQVGMGFNSQASSTLSGFPSQAIIQADSFQLGVGSAAKAKRRVVRAKRPTR